MAKPILQRPRVMASIGKRIATGMPQHVTVDGKAEASAFANALD